jgi:hypothetical protein
MSPKKSTKNALPEAIAGRLNFWYAAASYNQTTIDGTTESFQTLRNSVIVSPNQCSRVNLLDVAGWGFTGPDGKATLRLNEFICVRHALVDPVNLVATAKGDQPRAVTTDHSIDAGDVEMTFWTWNPDGTAAPDTSFDWRCRVVYFDPV